jgi:ParB/RepB/Spo0J family partition protein
MSGKTQNEAEARGTVFPAPMAKIYYQGDRENGGDGDLEKLANSMARHGLINAITVSDLDNTGHYRIITGRRRFEAAKRLGWATIEAKLLTPPDIDEGELSLEELSLAENVNREDMHPLDEAELFARQLADGKDIKEVAQYYNRSVSAIYQRVRLTDLIPEIKTLFREGKIAITAAALLAALEEKHQKKFYEKNSAYQDITIGMAESFLHSVQRNTLATVAGKKCEGCAKRTNHTNESLFPEDNGLKDVCFDDDCYAKQWTALLEKTLKKAKAKEGDTENIVVLNNIPKFYKGNVLTLDKTDYQIKKYDYYRNRADKEDPNAFYVWEFTVRWNSELELDRNRYKEAEEKTGQEKAKASGSEYAPEEVIEKVVDEVIGPEAPDFTPEDRALVAKDIDQAVKKRYGDQWDYRDSLDGAILKKIVQRHLEKPKNLFRELIKLLFAYLNDEQEKIYTVITGLPYSNDLAGIETIAPDTFIVLAFALQILEDNMSKPDNAEADDPPLQLGGLNVEEYQRLYNETAAELIADAVAHQNDPEEERIEIEDGDNAEEEDDEEEESG